MKLVKITRKDERLMIELLKDYLEHYGHWGMKEIPDLRVASKLLKKLKNTEDLHDTSTKN